MIELHERFRVGCERAFGKLKARASCHRESGEYQVLYFDTSFIENGSGSSR